MESERFRPLATVQGPFVSVYFDDSRDTADAVARVEAIWRDVRKHLEDQGTDQHVVANLEKPSCTANPPWAGRVAESSRRTTGCCSTST